MGVMIKAILFPQFGVLWKSHGSLALIVSIDVGVVCTHTHSNSKAPEEVTLKFHSNV